MVYLSQVNDMGLNSEFDNYFQEFNKKKLNGLIYGNFIWLEYNIFTCDKFATGAIYRRKFIA